MEECFANPPAEYRPGVYWYFNDGNLSMEGITKDLESMKKAGIGYVLFLEVNVGVPRGKVDYMSEEWQECFVHAVRECERLGITMALGIGPGWNGSGGPWVTGEQSMQHLVYSTADVTGGAGVQRISLPRPQPKRPFFGEGAFTPESLEKWRAYYRDVTVLAVPAGATRLDTAVVSGNEYLTIPEIDERALYYRKPYSSVEGVPPYIPMSGYTASRPGDKGIDPAQIIDLTGRLGEDGTLEWDAPAGEWTVLRFGAANNGAATRPAPMPGVGFESDKLDTAAIRDHLAQFTGKLFARAGFTKAAADGSGIQLLHIDSWEVGAQNWTPRLRQEFTKRRGYDPQPYYPAMAGLMVKSREASERFLWDLRQTCQELVLENHVGYVRRYAAKYGLKVTIEPYDLNPTADLELGAAADIPMAEFWSVHEGRGNFNAAFSVIEGSSAAHVIGSAVCPSEVFTSAFEGYRNYPGSLKNEGDWALAGGVNRFMYHTFAHQSLPDSLRPGMTMGIYGVHWDRGQTWWYLSDAYHRYIARCQYMLQQGRTVADVLYLTPEGAPHVFLPPQSALAWRAADVDKYDNFRKTSMMPDRRGYSFDGCPPSVFMKAAVKGSSVTLPGGATYRLVVMPRTETMTPALLAKLKELVGDGAIVVGLPPAQSPSLTDYPACDSEVRRIAAELWGDAAAPETWPETLQTRAFGKGRIIYGKELDTQADNLYPRYELTAGILSGITPPDFDCAGEVRYTHRTTAQGEDIYFVSSRTDVVQTVTAAFRVADRSPELWNPLTGEMRPLPEYQRQDGCTRIPLRLEPYESYFVVFRSKHRSSPSGGRNFPELREVSTLAQPWDVSFDPKWGGPAATTFATLTDWTQSEDPGIRYYSGTAVYRTAFEFAPNGEPLHSAPPRRYLDLGKVWNLARVRLNGQTLGTLWCAPWRVDISPALREGRNELEIEVVNLWVNRLLGDEQLPYDGITPDGRWPDWLTNGTPRISGRYTFTTTTEYRDYHVYSPRRMALSPSGLLGPVRILEECDGESLPLRVMTFNIWMGGGRSAEHTAEVIARSGATVVGIQESLRGDTNTAVRIADSLGWYSYSRQASETTLSRYAITDTSKLGYGVKIQLPGRRSVWMFNVHLFYWPYQPYQLHGIDYGGAPFLRTADEAVASAWVARRAQVEEVIADIRSVEADACPVVLTGDFNEPSWLDWTDRAAQAGLCKLPVAWPAERAFMESLGLHDSYRTIYPDEVARPGRTWTPLPAERDVPDRIDFVLYKGGLTPVASQIVGEDSPQSDIRFARYPSDHRAVLTTFE
jgi:hypothetical protein